jgi:hypothetical protein
MAQSNYRALQIVLGFFSLLFVIGGVFLLYSRASVIIRVFMHPPESEVSTLLLATLKEMGGFAIMLAVMLFFAARDPERNVAIIHGLIVGLCVLAATPLISLYTLDLGRLYPARLIWGRSLARLAFAGLLYYLRPRQTHWKPAGSF